MWVKILVGAVAGLIVGHWVEPGYAIWVVVGIILGVVVDLIMKAQVNKKTSEQ